MKRFTGYMKGVNLGGWLSQCDYSENTYENFITEKDFETIAGWGLDHVRVPVDYNLVENEDGTYIEDHFKYIDRAIEWSRKNKLNMVLDLHKTFGFFFHQGDHGNSLFTNEAVQERLYRLWEQFATRYGKYSDTVAFELLNEVTDKSFCDAWNMIAERCVERIRKIAPDVKILIGGYWNNSVDAVKDIAMPFDENIVYNFHCYSPFIFTHQGAHWCPDLFPAGYRLSYDHTYAEYEEERAGLYKEKHDGPDYFTFFEGDKKLGVEYFEKLFAEAVKVAEERDVAMYCGEYGVIEHAGAEDVLAWYKDIHAAFEKYGIGRAAWSFRAMDFDLVGARLDGVRPELVKNM